VLINSPAIHFDRNLSLFLIFAFTSGTLAHCLPAVLPVTKLTTDGLLFVLNGLVLYAVYRANQDKRLFTWLAIAYGFTFAMEAIGVATGAIFGEYHYGPTMWFQWLGVPFVIALNWCVLTLACNEMAAMTMERLFPNVAPPLPASSPTSPLHPAEGPGGRTNRLSHIAYPLSLITLAAVLTALYDVTIEPVAIALDYWQWHAGEIPLQNYLAWAAIAFLISLPLYVLNIRFRSPVLRVYFFAQLFFFAVLNFML
jgi:putative membrane protein